MIAYLEEKDDKKEIVFTQVTGDRNKIREKINNSKYGNSLDKYCLRKYLSESMLLTHNGYNESMFCNPKDIINNVDIDFEKLEEIFTDIDYENFIKNAEVYATRLLILEQDVVPNVCFKEINRMSYEEGYFNKNFERMLNLNTEILKLMSLRKKSKYNYDSENTQSILHNDRFFDDYFIEDAVLDMDKDEAQSKVKKLKKD